MKKLLLSLLLAQITIISFGQTGWYLNFEDTTYLDRVIIDTNNNHSNIWQIGQPNKTVFTNAKSSPNVIITDSENPYPTNDTSSFTIIHIASYGWFYQYPKVDLGGWYYVNSDSLTDYGYFEFSTDIGNTWYRTDSILGYCTWGAVEELPVFTGNTNGWKHFYYCFDPPVILNLGDTILYKFTFISDSVQTNKDGIMFDNLVFEDFYESIPEIENDNLIKIYPNPTNSNLFIESNTNAQNAIIQIYNSTGKLLYENYSFNEEYINTKALNLAKGIYFLKYSDGKHYTVKSFIVQE